MHADSIDPFFFIASAAGPADNFLDIPLQGKSTESRLFTARKDIEPITDDEVVDNIEAAQKRFEQEFAPKCDRLAHYLHERMAKGSKLQESHASWHRTHEPVTASIAEAKSKLKSYSKYIPLMLDAQKIMRAASSILYLEVLIESLEQKNTALCSLLTSQQHTTALRTYKSQVKACEGLGNTDPVEEKINALAKIFAATKKQYKSAIFELQGKDKNLERETTAIYEEIFLFCQYTANCLKKELPPQTTNDKLTLLITSIKKRLPPHLAGILEAQEQIVEQVNAPQNPENLYVESSRATALPTENHFRNGMWGASLIYSDLQTEIDKLQNIAKALYRLSKTLQERIKQMASGHTEAASGFDFLDHEAKHYTCLINGLERLIYAQLSQLTKKPLSTKCHAGWYYVASLLHQVKDLRMSCDQFTRLATGSYRFCVLALGKLTRFLDVANTCRGIVVGPVWIEPINRLFEATEAARALSVQPLPFHKRAYKIIHQSIAHAGLRSLALSAQESQIPSRLFTKAPFADDEHELLTSYLFKNFLRLTRFVNNPIDPEFEVVLHILRYEAAYEPLFTSIVRKTPVIDKLLTTYMQKSEINDYYIELELLKCACVALESARLATSGEDSSYAVILGYHEAKQLLEDLKDHNIKKFISRLDWLERSIRDFGSKYDALLNIDTELEQSSCKSLFRPLIAALFSSNIAASDAATVQITTEIEQRNFTTPKAQSLLDVLIKRWAIKNSQNL